MTEDLHPLSSYLFCWNKFDIVKPQFLNPSLSEVKMYFLFIH